MARIWTTLTGWLALLSALAAVVWELAAKSPALWDPTGTGALRAAGEPLPLPVVAGGCTLAWITASLATRRVDRQPEQRRNGLLGAVLGLTLGLSCLAALVPALGPHGSDGRRTEQVHQAGGGVHHVAVVQVLGPIRDTGTAIDHQRVYSVDLVVEVPFADHDRQLTLRDVAVTGTPSAGDPVSAVYAPTRPDLGALPGPDSDLGTQVDVFLGFLLSIVALGVCAGLSVAGGVNAERIARLRRFRSRVHLPALAALLGAAGLDAVVALAFPSTGLSWLLSVAALALVGGAAGWVLHGSGPVESRAS